jgi:tRNA(fMet)-specific endonuclease VapC
MSFLLDTDTCSAYIKANPRVLNRFVQYSGGLHVAAVTVGELYVWALRRRAPAHRLQQVQDLLQQVVVLDVNLPVAQKYGEVQAALLDAGTRAPEMDLLIAVTALVHGLTLVTHNTRHYTNVPGLSQVDWMVP